MRTVAERMTRHPMVIDVQQSLSEAMLRMEALKLHHLPVINGDGQLVGMLSERDIHRLRIRKPRLDPELAIVEEAMTSKPYVVTPDAQVAAVAAAMAENAIGAAVVMDGDRIAGVFTTTDALRTLAASTAPEGESEPRPASQPKILCPIDFSPGSREAVAAAIDLARAIGGSVTLFHAYDQPLVGLNEMMPVGSETLARLDKNAEAALRAWKAEWSRPAGPEVSIARGVGQAGPAITRHARDHGFDLIVIGTHGRSGLARAILGSVAENVTRHAPCPVLVVRQKDGEAKAA